MLPVQALDKSAFFEEVSLERLAPEAQLLVGDCAMIHLLGGYARGRIPEASLLPAGLGGSCSHAHSDTCLHESTIPVQPYLCIRAFLDVLDGCFIELHIHG